MDPVNDIYAGDQVDNLILPDVSDGSTFVPTSSPASASGGGSPAIASTVYNPANPPTDASGRVPIPLTPFSVDPTTGIIYNALGQPVAPDSSNGGASSSNLPPASSSSSSPASSSSSSPVPIGVIVAAVGIGIALLAASRRRR